MLHNAPAKIQLSVKLKLKSLDKEHMQIDQELSRYGELFSSSFGIDDLLELGFFEQALAKAQQHLNDILEVTAICYTKFREYESKYKEDKQSQVTSLEAERSTKVQGKKALSHKEYARNLSTSKNHALTELKANKEAEAAKLYLDGYSRGLSTYIEKVRGYLDAMYEIIEKKGYFEAVSQNLIWFDELDNALKKTEDIFDHEWIENTDKQALRNSIKKFQTATILFRYSVLSKALRGIYNAKQREILDAAIEPLKLLMSEHFDVLGKIYKDTKGGKIIEYKKNDQMVQYNQRDYFESYIFFIFDKIRWEMLKRDNNAAKESLFEFLFLLLTTEDEEAYRNKYVPGLARVLAMLGVYYFDESELKPLLNADLSLYRDQLLIKFNSGFTDYCVKRAPKNEALKKDIPKFVAAFKKVFISVLSADSLVGWSNKLSALYTDPAAFLESELDYLADELAEPIAHPKPSVEDIFEGLRRMCQIIEPFMLPDGTYWLMQADVSATGQMAMHPIPFNPTEFPTGKRLLLTNVEIFVQECYRPIAKGIESLIFPENEDSTIGLENARKALQWDLELSDLLLSAKTQDATQVDQLEYMLVETRARVKWIENYCHMLHEKINLASEEHKQQEELEKWLNAEISKKPKNKKGKQKAKETKGSTCSSKSVDIEAEENIDEHNEDVAEEQLKEQEIEALNAMVESAEQRLSEKLHIVEKPKPTEVKPIPFTQAMCEKLFSRLKKQSALEVITDYEQEEKEYNDGVLPSKSFRVIKKLVLSMDWLRSLVRYDPYRNEEKLQNLYVANEAGLSVLKLCEHLRKLLKNVDSTQLAGPKQIEEYQEENGWLAKTAERYQRVSTEVNQKILTLSESLKKSREELKKNRPDIWNGEKSSVSVLTQLRRRIEDNTKMASENREGFLSIRNDSVAEIRKVQPKCTL